VVLSRFIFLQFPLVFVHRTLPAQCESIIYVVAARMLLETGATWLLLRTSRLFLSGLRVSKVAEDKEPRLSLLVIDGHAKMGARTRDERD